MTHIIVAGGAGLIGSHLVKKLLELGNKVVIMDNFQRGTEKNIKDLDAGVIQIDLRDQVSVYKYINLLRPDEIYHLAAHLGGVSYYPKHNAELYRDNLQMGLNILEACRMFKVNKLLYTSTACVYPVSRQLVPDCPLLKEEDVLPLECESGYGWAKYYLEMVCDAYIKQYNMNIAINRMFNVYGPRESYNDDSHVVPMLIRKAIEYPDKPFTIWGDGKQTRQFTYVEDAVDGILALMDKGINKGPINIGSDERVSIGTLADKIIKISGKDIKKEYDLTKPSGVIGRAADYTKARKILNWYPKTKLEDGLKITYEWMKKDIEG